MADDMTHHVTEKVYCYDHPSAYAKDNSGMWAALVNNRGCDYNNAMMWNNPLIYFLLFSMFRNNGYGDSDINSRLSALQSTMDNNHNNDLAMQAINNNASAIRELQGVINTDFNSLSTALCGVRNAITEVGGKIDFSAERVINAANVGDLNIIQQLKDCCCTTQQNIQRMGYENQLAIKEQTYQLGERFTGIANGIQQGFSAVAYESQKQTCDIINAGEKNTQRIIDVLNNHWQADLQQRYNDARLELSQKTQNEYLINQLKGNCGC